MYLKIIQKSNFLKFVYNYLEKFIKRNYFVFFKLNLEKYNFRKKFFFYGTKQIDDKKKSIVIL
jgi:hypothetical protein